MRIFILLTFIHLLTLNAFSAEWVLTGSSAEKNQNTYIDKSSIRVEGQNKKVWVKHTGLEQVVNNITIKEQRVYYLINCNDNKFKVLDAIAYDNAGMLHVLSRIDKWTSIPPDTSINSVSGYVCNYKP